MKKLNIIILLLILSVSVTLAQESNAKVNFSMEGIATLEVSSSFCDIYAVGHNGNSLDFTGEIVGTNSRDYEIKYERNGDRLKIWVDNKSSRSWNAGMINGKFEIKIPKGTKSELKSSSGNIEASEMAATQLLFNATSGDLVLSNITAKTLATTTSGNINLKYLKGDVDLVSTSGDIDALSISGNVEYKSTSGNVEIDGVGGPKILGRSTSGDHILSNATGTFSLVTTSGNMSAKSINVTESSSFQTTSGDINITVKDKPEAYRFSARTSSGSINIGSVRGGKEVEIGDSDKRRISLVTSSGNITVK